MKRYLTIILFFAALTATAADRIWQQEVRSLTATVNGQWRSLPILRLGTDDVLTVGFDECSHDVHRYTVHLNRCEWDWSPSTRFESEWMQGFNDFPINDYQHSINTTVSYTHYALTIPNQQCQLTLSGNYRLTVLDADNGDKKVLETEFYVLDSRTNVQLSVTANTDVDTHAAHQQVEAEVGFGSLRVTDARQQIRAVFMQNRQQPRYDVTPTQFTANSLRWQHCRDLVFKAGNEYHKFEMLDVSHPTMGLEDVTWDGHAYQAFPFATGERPNYLTDVSAQGAFLIRNSENTEVNYTCDYLWVNYRLKAPYQGDLFVDGRWATAADRSCYRMTYDASQQLYTASILQKQGYYSYTYRDRDGQPARTEGNFYQTHNSYQMLVYYRAPGEATWQLAGYRELESR